MLAGARLRIGEALTLRWAYVDLATGTLHVVDAKTAAGVRSVDLTPALREELVLWRAESRVLTPAIEEANVDLEKAGIALIGAITFHSLRRTYASLRCACGDDVRYTAAQIGHEDPRFTLRAYAQATKRRERLSGPHLNAYDRALDWARMGTIASDEPMVVPDEATKSPV